MKLTKEKKSPKAISTNNRAERIQKKAASASTNEASVAAELKNREHGNEQPAR
jgi:hypothetical protein